MIHLTAYEGRGKYSNKKVLILGHARHGKDTVADILHNEFNLKCSSSSMSVLDSFLFKILNKKYKLNYKNTKEAFKDRMNVRKIWFDEISKYNKNDKTRLAREVLKTNDIYVGLRSAEEIEACIKRGVFDLIIGVYDNRKPHENNVNWNLGTYCDYIIQNNGSLEELKARILHYFR
tara:strand:+ start:598 stop:1125 length:528 start_codon:yes stop_codon:yes gene_type:complete